MTEDERNKLISARLRDGTKVPTAPGAYQSARRSLAIEQLIEEGIL